MSFSPNPGKPIHSACPLPEDGRRFEGVPQGHVGVAIDQGVVHRSARLANIIDREPGLDTGFSGQSPRVGMAEDLADDGASIMQAGRWNPAATLGHYIERMDAQRRAVANLLEIR